MQNYNTLTINIFQIDANVRRFAPLAVMPMLKANAYGVGALPLARHYETQGAPLIGVSHLSEAIALREAGIEMPIFVVGVPANEMKEVVAYRLQPAISDLDFPLCGKTTVHLAINTGMQRFGCRPEEAASLIARIEAHPLLECAGIMTHFVAAETPEMDAKTLEQIAQMEALLAHFNSPPKWIHLANSAGAGRFSVPFANLARIGIAQFEGALTLESTIIALHTIARGETVGYGTHYRARRERERIAVLPIGYHDGLHLCYSGKGHVLVRGMAAPYVGKICMDFMMVDVTNILEAKLGDRVEVFGRELPPETVASWGGVDVRQLLCCLGPRIERRYSYDNRSEKLQQTLRSFEKDPSSR